MKYFKIVKLYTKIIRNGAVTLPTRAKKPHIPNAVPRQIVGNNSQLYNVIADNADKPTDFVITAKEMIILSKTNNQINK